MAEISEQSIVINDLLSFLTCKSKFTPKEKLLSCINNYYSEAAIVEAQKALLTALPIKKSTRHGRRAKHPDTAVAIYDCIQLIPKDDLPVFVCKDLNNVPHLKSPDNAEKMFSIRKPDEVMANREEDNEDETDEEEEKMNEDLYRKEQKQMRSQISEMFSIITELKNGLQKYTGTGTSTSTTKASNPPKKKELDKNPKTRRHSQDNNSNPKYARLSSIKKENQEEEDSDEDDNLEEVEDKDSEDMDKEDSESEGNSQLGGLALIQKLIDEDDDSNKFDLLEKDSNRNDLDEDLDYIDEFEELENFAGKEQRGGANSFQLNLNKLQFSAAETRATGTPFKKPGVVVAPSPHSGQNIIYIKTDDMQVSQSIDVDSTELNSEMEKSIEIAGSADFMGQCSDMEEAQEQSHRVPLLYPNEVLLHVKEEKTEESDASHQKRNYQCHYCLEVFTAYRKLRKHVATHCIVKNSYNCVICHQKCMNRDELREHFSDCLEKSKDKYIKNICNVCKTFYASEKFLIQHKNLHEEFRPHGCPHCSYKYLNKATLDTHVKNQHSGLNQFFCPFCPHSSIANAYLNKHIRVHTGEAPFECKTCGHKTKTKFLLKRHMEHHGPLRERKCDKCNLVCVGLNEYLRHRRKQHGKPIVCHICKLCFRESSSFVRHYNLHTQKKPYKCDHCLYRATGKESLRLHKVTHTGPNVQLCPECNVPCINKRNLRRHLEHYCSNLEKEK